jgi:multidrug resistance efflux pump
MKTARRAIAYAAGLGLATLSLVIASRAFSSDQGPAGRTVTEAPAPEAPAVVCFGHVDLEHGITSLYPVQPGRVEQVPAVEGKQASAGQVLLRLDRRPAEYAVRLARADLDAAQAQRDQAQKLIDQQAIKETEQQAVIDAVRFRLQAAESLLSRKEQLRAVQTNDKELEAARAQREELKAVVRGEEGKLAELRLNDPRLSLRRAEADVAAKQARLDQALLALNECDLKAPADGTVLRVFAHVGEVLGAQPQRPALLFCPREPRVIRAEVEQEFAGRVAVGQPASIQDDSSSSETWKGTVASISDWYSHRRSILQEPLQMNDVRTLECVITLDPGQPPLRIGQRVRVHIGATG